MDTGWYKRGGCGLVRLKRMLMVSSQIEGSGQVNSMAEMEMSGRNVVEGARRFATALAAPVLRSAKDEEGS